MDPNDAKQSADLGISTRAPRVWMLATPLTLDEIKRITQLHENKFTVDECLQLIGRTRPAVEFLSRVGDPEKDGICELRRAGWSYAKIQQVTGRNQNTIAKIINVDQTGARKSSRLWRCGKCGGLTKLSRCEGCFVRGLTDSQRLNQRDAKKHAVDWSRKLAGRPARRII